MNKNLGLRTWVEVNTKALRNNYQIFRKIAGKSLLMAVVKSNAYGHCLIDYSLIMDKFGIDWFGVDSITEALALREAGIKKPILVLGYTLPENYSEALKCDISLTISSLEQLEKVRSALLCHSVKSENPGTDPRIKPMDDKFYRKLKIHLKIDTGMHRQGLFLGEVEKALQFIQEKLPFVILEGVYTHFASAKNPSDAKEAKKQLTSFKSTFKTFDKYGFSPIKHSAATAGLLTLPDSRLDMVRVGIGLTGFWPSFETKKKFLNKIKLSPALCWETMISEIKGLKKGERIGYGFTAKLKRDSKIAICPVGYWHGIRRSLSNRGHLTVAGEKALIIGLISMDMLAIDVTGIKKATVGSIVTIIGNKKGENLPEDIARLCHSYQYEILTQINPLIKRIYI